MSLDYAIPTGRPMVAHGVRQIAPNAMAVDAAEGLDLIQRGDLNLIVWERTSAPDVRHLVASAPHARDENTSQPGRLVFAHDILRGCSLHICQILGSEAADVMALAIDVAVLTEGLFQATGASAARLSLERLDHDGCRFFHAYMVAFRMLCSYAGKGTQWLPESAVTRDATGRATNARADHSAADILTLATGSVALIKGDAGHGGSRFGLLHRSPPTTRRDDPRLLLRLDPLGLGP